MSTRRVALVATHPIQYHAPWMRAVAESGEIDLHVFFCHRQEGSGQARAGFGVEFDWDVPLTEGYPHTFLRNTAAAPGVDSFSGTNNPDIGRELERGFHAVIVMGWFFRGAWQALRAAKRLRLPVLAVSDSTLTEARPPLRALAKRLLYPQLLSQFAGFLTPGSRAEAYLRYYGCPPERIFRVPYSVDSSLFRPAEEAARRAARRTFGLRPDSVVAVCAAKLIPLKRVGDFVSAVAQAGNIQGLIVGDGPERATVEAAVASRGADVRIAGFLNQSRMPEAFAAADFLVLPSERETWGYVVNEAMCCGLPCLVSERAGCAPDLIQEGVTGYTFRPGDTESLAGIMRTLAEDAALRAAMGTEATRLMEKYSPAASANQLLAAIRAIVPLGP